MDTGIYTITNLINGKIYVGYAKRLKYRLLEHKNKLRNNNHPNIYLQDSVNKYGLENFSFEVLEKYDYEFCPSLEHYWCNILNTHDRRFGYNLGRTSNTFSNEGSDNWYFGRKHSKETIEKIKINTPSRKGIDYKKFYGDFAEEERKKRSDATKDYWENISEEEKAKRNINLSNALKGKFSRGHNPFAQPVLINNIEFKCVKDACDFFSTSLYLLRKNFKITKLNKKCQK